MFLSNSAFWREAGTRALKTFAQALIALLGAGAVNLLAVDWATDLSVAAGAAVLSLLTSIVTGSSTLAVANGKALRRAAQQKGAYPR